MENASKALIIAGAILLSILIIAIGMFIYTSSQGTINDSMSQMSTQEIEGFNSQFTIYGGQQTGSKLKSLCGTLIANANTYNEEPAKLPEVDISQLNATDSSGVQAARPTTGGEAGLEDYISKVSQIRNKIENKHTFTVEFDYNTKGVLTKIRIGYDGAYEGSTTGTGTGTSTT